MKNAILSLLFLCSSVLSMAQFQAADKININEVFSDDLYLAGGDIEINAPIRGDLMIAGGQIHINDSIAQDLTVAGGNIIIRGHIGDDLRIAGGNIDIMAEIGDDLVIFGGSVILAPGSVVKGNLIIYGGEIDISGEVRGGVKASGGTIRMNSTVRGPSEIATGTLSIGKDAAFYSNVDYWTELGKQKFGNSLRGSSAANFKEGLSMEANDYSKASSIFGGFTFFILFLLGGFVIITLLNLAFAKWFYTAATQIDNELFKTLGAGGIYVICLPILIMFAFFIVIAIPVGFFLLMLYIFSLLFGIFVVALCLTYLLRQNRSKDWGFWKTSIIALGFAFVIQLLTLIPYVGFMIYILFLTLGYGGIILSMLASRKKYRDQIQSIAKS